MVEDEGGLVGVQLADLHGDDAALCVGEHREREHRIDTEGIGCGQPVLLADQQRIVEADLGSVLEDIFAEVDGDAEHLHAARAALIAQLAQQRDLAAAGGAPGRPEVDDERGVLEGRQLAQRPFGGCQREVGQHGRDDPRGFATRLRAIAARLGRCGGARYTTACRRGGCLAGQVEIDRRAGKERREHDGQDESFHGVLPGVLPALSGWLRVACVAMAANSAAFMNPTTRYCVRSDPSGLQNAMVGGPKIPKRCNSA